MKNIFGALLAFAILFALAAASQAASFDFTFENKSRLRATRVVLIASDGEISGFSSMGRGEQVFQVTLPDGQCRATLRFYFSGTLGGRGFPNYELENHDFCWGPNEVTLSSR